MIILKMKKTGQPEIALENPAQNMTLSIMQSAQAAVNLGTLEYIIYKRIPDLIDIGGGKDGTN